ncbi:MAG TPA: HAD family phosphatase [Streptosporangiaceae bacterium]|nr:HAD family phosphatase [Streptosporangiaceae bacterium]
MPGQEITAVVFDLGGVLLDWDPRHLYRRLFADPAEMEDFLARICTPDWHRAHDLGENVTRSCRRLARQHPRYRDMIMAWADPADEMAAGQIDEAVGVLAELKERGVRCLVLSNMEPATFAARQGRFAFMNWFDGYVISGLEGVAKPDPRIFQLLLSRYQLAPAATVFIDDSPVNIRAARAQGMIAVQYPPAGGLRNQLRSLGVTALSPALP